MPLDLDQLTDQPTLIPIGDRVYAFSELPMDQLGRLQKYIRATVPNPLVAVRPYLPDFTPAQQEMLLDQARRDALAWPPKIGTPAGASVLMNSEAGQLETLTVALQQHHPETTPADAAALYRTLKREAREARKARKAATAAGLADGVAVDSDKATRIFAITFGMDELLEDRDGPKDQGATAPTPAPSPST